MNIQKIINEANKIEGWFYDNQMNDLYPIVKDINPNGLIVEIGTYRGKSSRFFSLVNPSLKIFTIDINTKISNDSLKQGNIFQIIKDNKDVCGGFNWKIDLLFIDAGHSHNEVTSDIKNWTPFVKNDGYVVFHDYKDQWPGVKSAVDQWIENTNNFIKLSSNNDLFIAKRRNYV